MLLQLSNGGFCCAMVVVFLLETRYNYKSNSTLLWQHPHLEHKEVMLFLSAESTILSEREEASNLVLWEEQTGGNMT